MNKTIILTLLVLLVISCVNAGYGCPNNAKCRDYCINRAVPKVRNDLRGKRPYTGVCSGVLNLRCDCYY